MLKIYPLIPLLAALLIPAAAMILFLRSMRSAAGLPSAAKKVLAGLGAVLFLLYFIMFLSPGFTIREPDRRNSNIVFLLDGSSSMATPDGPGGSSRFEEGKKVLNELKSSLPEKCGKYICIFNGRTVPADDGEEVESFVPAGSTDLRKAFETMEKDIDANSISSVVVISDGLDQSLFTGTKGAYGVFAVKTGSDLGNFPDLGIGSFRIPSFVRIGEKAELKIPVTLNGFSSPQKVTLTTELDGTLLSKQEKTLFPRKTDFFSVSTVLTENGLHTLRFTLNHLPDEISFLNNARECVIEVRENTMETLLYYPVLNTSFRPLVRFLAGKNFTAVYRLSSGRCSIVSNGLSAKAFARGFPKDASLLRKTDVILLGSGDAANFTKQEIAVLEKYVSDGGSLVIPGGPGAFRNIDRRFSSMLPVRGTCPYLNGKFEVLSENTESPFADFASSHAQIRGVSCAEQIKLQAETLLKVRSESGVYPLILAMPYGKGRVIAVMTNSLHLLGSGPERKKLFRSLWEQILAYASEERSGRMKIAVNTENPSAGEKLEVSAVLPDEDSYAEAELLSADSSRRLRSPVRLRRENLMHRTVFENLPDGKVILKVTARGRNHAPVTRYRWIVSGESALENTDLRCIDENFHRFASRGRVFSSGELNSLKSELLKNIRKNEIRREFYPVFETPFFLISIFLVLSAIYFLRRKYNLF